MLKIVQSPASVLSETAKPVGKIDKGINQLLEQMKESLLAAQDPQGVGLAAPQVGRSLRLFITKRSEKAPFQVFINPEILALKKAEQHAEPRRKDQRISASGSARFRASNKLEGCLSLQDIWGNVIRPNIVELSYLDEHGKKHKKKFTNFLATIIQHEMDHLDGVLFPKRVLEQKGKLYKSKKDEKGKTIFDEIDI